MGIVLFFYEAPDKKFEFQDGEIPLPGKVYQLSW